MMPQSHGSWIEVGASALEHNVHTFRGLVGPDRSLAVVVKANAYGHGILEVARLAVGAGADWLLVFTAGEAFALREAGIDVPVLILGPTPDEALPRAAAEGIRVTVAEPSRVEALRSLGLPAGSPALSVHVKLETGTQRQGFVASALDAVASLAKLPSVRLEGAYSHFANIEDTTDHTFAMQQLETFGARVDALRARGVEPPILHTASTAAALLFPSTHLQLVRVGIGAYGLWPSRETLVSTRHEGRPPLELLPVMTWKTRVCELKEVPAGMSVGYGRTYKTGRPSTLAVLPVGYANGYDRGLSNHAHVLVRGQRASVRGRVMMNMTIVDVTDVEGAAVGDEVVLLGDQGDEHLPAEMMAAWLDTISYEVVTRADPLAPRLVV